MKTLLLRSPQVAALCTLLSVTPFVGHASDIVVSQPGRTIVQDAEDDVMAVSCNPAAPNRPCTLPPGAPHALPGWHDIKTAKVHRIGRDRVDFSIALHEPVPAMPPVPFLAYFWQFQDGCVEPSPTNKDGIRVLWDGTMWFAHWYEITSCNPRAVNIGNAIPFEVTDEGIRARVSLGDLMTVVGSTEPLYWFAGVRRLPFIHPVFTSTVAVDVAPDVLEFNPTPPPAFVFPDDSAPWQR